MGRKLVRFGCEIDEKILDEWKETINHNELIRERIEKILIEDTEKNKKRREKS